MKEAGMHIERSELVADFTEGRTDSLKELSPLEYQEFIKALNNLLGANDTPRDVKSRMRRKVIAILCQCGYTAEGKADMTRINQWCISHGNAHSILNQYSKPQLQKLIIQAEAMLTTTIKSL